MGSHDGLVVGDVVVFASPDRQEGSLDGIKRIAALVVRHGTCYVARGVQRATWHRGMAPRHGTAA